MFTDPQMAAKAIIKIAKRMYARNMLAACDGNISVRFGTEQLLMTPSGTEKAYLRKKQICVLKMSGEVLQGKPSSESAVHLAIYAAISRAQAVIHAHAPHVIAYTLARPEIKEFPVEALPEVLLGMGRVPILGYLKPGTDELAQAVSTTLNSTTYAVTLGGHGVFCWGPSLAEAYRALERLEHAAQMLCVAESMGGVRLRLSEEQRTWLWEKRASWPEKIL